MGGELEALQTRRAHTQTPKPRNGGQQVLVDKRREIGPERGLGTLGGPGTVVELERALARIRTYHNALSAALGVSIHSRPSIPVVGCWPERFEGTLVRRGKRIMVHFGQLASVRCKPRFDGEWLGATTYA